MQFHRPTNVLVAEGNPDEEKIGAFGVGFYSLFSVTEEPFVTSGGKWMGFYWKDKKDQVCYYCNSSPCNHETHVHKLFARRGDLPHQTNDPWTTFEMDLREPTPIPAAFDFTRFLVSSITFMAHLREVTVYFDDKRLVHLTKDAGIPKQLVIPRSLRPTSTMGFMNIKGLKSARKPFDCHRICLLRTTTLCSPPHYRGRHEMGLQRWDREA